MRLVLVTRSFWPRVGGAETVMARLAGEFQHQGAQVTVLTARWNPRWPETIDHRGVRVVRLAQPGLRFWGTWRYMRKLDAWLSARRAQFDLVYVSMFKHDAYATLGAARRARFPVALRAEGAGLSGDMHWQLEARFGRRIKQRCATAGAFIAPSRAIQEELIAAGYRRSRIHLIPNGVAVSADGETTATHRAQRRAQARRELAQSNHELAFVGEAPLALYTGRLHEAKGLMDLVRAWPGVRERVPGACLWLAGEGPLRTALAAEIIEQGLAGAVVLAGSFDAVDDLLTAADVFVLPSYEEGMSVALLEALAAGLPVVASDIPGNRDLVEHETHGLLVAPGDAAGWVQAIAATVHDAEAAARRAAAARARVAAEFSLSRAVRTHWELFERLIHEAPPD
ncbi:MAG: glycosyltransferase family 4 protein [Pirellulales bacterium]|nr:glycosyltransferase family 4 protein [Pirellulales bacterium]